MPDTDHCPRCGDIVTRAAVDIDGIGSQRIECSSCARTLVGIPCPECSPDGSDPEGADEDCPTCGGNGVRLTSLEELFS
jgi:predicted RNA-binding Zn-ribbon protein involved in translation (DUF1610 family)